MSATPRFKVRADRTRCAGTSQCVLAHPDVFGTDASGFVLVKHDHVDDVPALREALDMCPTQALSLLDAETNEVLYP